MKHKTKGAVLIFVLGMLMALSGLVSVFISSVIQDVLLKFQIQGKGDLKHHAENAFNAVWCGLEDALRKDKLCSPLQGWNHVISSVNTSVHISRNLGFPHLKKKTTQKPENLDHG